MGDVTKTLLRVQELRSAGLVPNRDFTWLFSPYGYDNMTGEVKQPYCEFRFQDEQYARFYTLKCL